jgi:uncharacterized membrane protein YbhN (UPF0104 family)
LVMGFVAYWFIPSGQRESDMAGVSFGGLSKLEEYWWIAAILAGLAAIIFIAFLLTQKGRRMLAGACHIISVRGHKLVEESKVAIKIYYNKKLALAVALLLTFACQVVAIVAVWIIGLQIGITASFRYYLIFFPISWILGLVPISVGGAGVTEWWLKDMFIHVCAVSAQNASALALYNRILILIGSLPGAVIHLMGAHLPKEFSIDSEDPLN